MKLILIPPGEFKMGSAETDSDATPPERPQHLVRLTQPYYLGKYEVTQGEYEAVMGVNPSGCKQSGTRAPVEQVSWLDAVMYCNKLSETERLRACYKIEGNEVTMLGGTGYRLPTEAEWEYACRAGTTTKFAFGDDEAGLGDVAWFYENSRSQTSAVGEKMPNPFGLHDMHGNVWEWCWDGYGEFYYGSAVAVDPTGLPGGSIRAIRGGCWFTTAQHCRAACREGYPPNRRADVAGFRVLRSPAARD
jgi:formylglycine-generating enzyme required for sulfatase activity